MPGTGTETAGSQDRIEAMKMAAKFKLLHPESDVNEMLGRLFVSEVFSSDSDLRTAFYYLTDEDYANERHAILFFANKLC